MALITINAVVDIPADIRVVEIGRVIAAMASGALKDGVVVRISVTRGAHVIRIAVTRREPRVLRVIERGPGPCRRVVAGRARGREVLRLRLVAWVRRVVVVRLMAAHASDGQRRVIVVDVAVRANPWRHQVRARQRECGVVVVEGGVRPDSGVVAQFARGREAGGRVRRIGRARIVLLMARVAQGAVQGIVVAYVAVCAQPRRHDVGARQCKTGGGVVEGCVGPQHGVMTGCARGRERSRNMVYRRSRIVVIGLVARHAGRARQIVVVVNVAIGTQPRRHEMRTGEREPGRAVVERRVEPGRRAVARVASLREVRCDVIRVRCALEIGQMARDAGRTIQGIVVIHVAVCTLTRRHCVQTSQREPRAVVVEGCVQPGRCAVA